MPKKSINALHSVFVRSLERKIGYFVEIYHKDFESFLDDIEKEIFNDFDDLIDSEAELLSVMVINEILHMLLEKYNGIINQSHDHRKFYKKMQILLSLEKAE